MDPGNWATSLAGGSAFGYTLLSVVVLSSLMAMLLQALQPQARDRQRPRPRPGLPRPLRRPAGIALWALCEIAIVRDRPRRGDRHRDRAQSPVRAAAAARGRADRARRAPDPGPAGARLPLARGVHHRPGRDDRPLLCLRDRALARRRWSGVLGGLLPSPEIATNPAMLYIAIGILGATVMPHNLYLHSAIIQTRRYGLTERQAPGDPASRPSTARSR